MFTYKQIIGQVKKSNYPYYRLRGAMDLFTSKTINIGDNLSEESPTVDAVLSSLKEHIDICIEENPKFVFELELFKTPNSNQNGKHGPFSFIVKSAPEVKTEETTNNQGFDGFGKLKEHSEALRKMQNDLFQPRLDFQVEKMGLVIQQNDLERERKEFDKFKTEKELELKELKKDYGKKTNIAQKGFEKAAFSLLEKFTDDGKGLSGAFETGETTDPSKEEKWIESIALNILQHQEAGDIDLDDIKTIGIAVQKKINEIKE